MAAQLKIGRLAAQLMIGPRYPVAVRPSIAEMLAAALLVTVLSGLVVLIVLATIPAGGPPALR